MGEATGQRGSVVSGDQSLALRWPVGMLVVVVTTALGAGIAYWFETLPPPVAEVEVIEPTVQVDDDGQRTAMVRWEDEFGSHARTVVIPDAYQGQSRVPLERVDGEYRVLVPGETDWTVTVASGLVGTLFGLVVVATAAGYGFVRGRGESGTMSQTDVSEAQGFYWRS